MTDHRPHKISSTDTGGIEFEATDENGDTRKWAFEQASNNQLLIVVTQPDGTRDQYQATKVGGNITVE